MIIQPYPNFIRPDAGGNVKPVSSGKIYIGKENMDPMLGGVPIYYTDNQDVVKEIPNPIILNMTGVPVASKFDKTIISPYVHEPISILIEDSNGNPVYTKLSNVDQIGSIKESSTFVKTFKASNGKSAVENMLAGNPVEISVGDNCACEYGSHFKRVADTGDISDFDPISDVFINDFYGSDMQSHATAMLVCFDYANSKDTSVSAKSNSDFVMLGNDEITIKQSIDWNGAYVDVSGWNGVFKVRRKKDKVSYNVGDSIVDGINSGGDIEPSKTVINAWVNKKEVNDSFVLITTDIDQYQYRGDLQKWREFNTVSNFGVLTSPLKYGLRAGSVVSVQVWPFEDKWSHFKNVTFDLKAMDIARTQFIDVETSLFKMEGIKFKDDQRVRQFWNNVVINFNNCAKIVVDGMVFQSAGITTEGTGSNYLFNFNNSYDGIFRNCRGTGDGWGSTANYDPQRVTYEHCQISRIDFHRPMREYCKILHCDIGQWGITASTLGDLIIKDTNFYTDNAYENVNSTGIIRAREDTSALCDGELIIERCSVHLNNNRNILSVSESINMEYPVDSPVNPVTFNKITYRDITAYQSRLDLSTLNKGVLVGDAKKTESCPLIVIDNCKYVSFRQELQDAKPYGGAVSRNTSAQGDYLNRVNFRLICDKIAFRADNEFSRLEVIDTSIDRFYVDLVVSNSHADENQGVYRGGFPAYLSFTGRASFSNSTLGYMDFTGFSSHEMHVAINGGKIRKNNTFAGGFFNNKLEQFDVSVTGTQIVGNEDTAEDMLKCRLRGVTWSIRNIATTKDKYTIGNLGGSTITLPSGVDLSNTYEHRILHSGVNYRVQFKLPASDSSRTVVNLPNTISANGSLTYQIANGVLSVTPVGVDSSNLQDISVIS